MSSKLRAKGRRAYLYFLFSCVAFSFGMLLSHDTRAENLLLNPSFEEEGQPGEVPNWVNEGFAGGLDVFGSIDPFEGNWMLARQWIQEASRYRVHQAVTVEIGQTYSARCFFARASTGSDDVGVYGRVGIDATGGQDAEAPSLQWGSDTTIPRNGAWVSAAIETVPAISSTMTVFCEGETSGPLYPGGGNFVWLFLDAALLEPYLGTPTPTPPPTHTPAPTNTPTYPPGGISGFALDFDASAFALTDHQPALNLEGQFTLEAWVFRRASGPYWQVAVAKDATKPYGLTVSADELLHFELVDSNENRTALNTPPGSVPFNTWTHIAGTWDGTTMRAYVNGVELASENKSGNIFINDQPFVIGAARRDYSYEFWNGVIDEVRVWNVARSGAEIRDSSAIPLTGNEAGLVAYWSFDEGSGQWAYDQGMNNITLRLGAGEIPDYYDPAWVISDIPGFGSHAGRIRFDSEAYPCAGTIGITLTDIDLVDDATSPVELSSSSGDIETVVLTESHDASPILEGSVQLAPGSPVVEDGTLQVAHGEIVTGTYEDADDGTGNPAIAQATAEIDCVPPVITNVAVTDAGFDSATVAIETAEPASALVRYGTSCSEPSRVESSEIPATLHLITMEGLTPETEYFFVVEVKDAAGNEAIDDNEGLCYSFKTVPRNFALEFHGNQFAQADPNPALDLAENDQFTLEAWISRRATPRYWQVALSKGNTDPYGLTVSGDRFLHFELSTTAGRRQLNTPPGTVPFNTWTHIAGTWDGSFMRAYVNGIESASRELGGHMITTISPFLVGAARTDGREGWHGVIDAVRLWNVARPPTEIQASMLDQLTGNETGFVAGWNLNEGTGQFAYDPSPNLIRLRLGMSKNPDWRDPLWFPAFRVDLDAWIEPRLPRTTDDLECIVTVAPPAEIGDLDLTYTWIRDGEIIVDPMEFNGDMYSPIQPVLDHHFTAKNETYFCVVMTTNETPFSRTHTAAVEIINSTPTAPVVRIDPENPQPSDGLMVWIIHPSTDPDGDYTGYAVYWYRSQDGGETFDLIPGLTWITVPPGLLAEGDLWRVEVVPIDLGDAGSEGEAGWDQVYVGVNNRPAVAITRPGPQNAIALPTVTIAWEAEDIDGDAVTVDLYYDTDAIEGGGFPIAMDQPQTGSMSWQPPGADASFASADLSGDGLVDAEDLFILASRWYDVPEKARYRIFARAWDEKGAIGEAFSPGEVIVPEGFPTNTEGLLRALGEWSQE